MFCQHLFLFCRHVPVPMFLADYDSQPSQPEAEKYYTLPRSGEISAAYRQMFARRPASTAGEL